jgi:predicted unusual protein kinase regulating ubiquinone biosynthesis (AarF/ABC1/UbiB family)
MMSYANSKQRNGFLLAVVHVVNRDWNELVKLYVRLGFIPEGTDLRVIEDALENALPDILNADVTELNFKNVINKLGDIMYVYVGLRISAKLKRICPNISVSCLFIIQVYVSILLATLLHCYH